MRTVMLTGDNEVTARAIADRLGGIEFIAGVLPDGKEDVVRNLMEDGRVAMVGDGINDAPALVRTDVGIAIGNGTDIAIDSADVVLMRPTLMQLPGAIRLSRATLSVIHQNLFWAFIYNTSFKSNLSILFLLLISGARLLTYCKPLMDFAIV